MKPIFLTAVFFVFSLTSTMGQNHELIYDSEQAKSEIERLIHEFKGLTEKLPTYDKYYPNTYSMDRNGKLGMQLIAEEESPKDILACRKRLAEIIKADSSYADFKIMAFCFLEEVENPATKESLSAVVMYVEHKNEANGYAYYFPYVKTTSELKFKPEQNFRKLASKLVLI